MLIIPLNYLASINYLNNARQKFTHGINSKKHAARVTVLRGFALPRPSGRPGEESSSAASSCSPSPQPPSIRSSLIGGRWSRRPKRIVKGRICCCSSLSLFSRVEPNSQIPVQIGIFLQYFGLIYSF